MPIDNHDQAYGFVLEANEKEARNKRKRAERRDRAKNPSPWWSVFSATLMIGITTMHAHDGNTPMASFFALLTVWHIYLAYLLWKKRRSFS